MERMNEPDSLKINISLLQTFHLVAKHGSFSAAARALNITYQTASNHIRRLEQLYGFKLIQSDQGARKISLTSQGRALFASLSGELDNILSRISLLLQNQRSSLRVGVPQALFHQFFPQILTAFKLRAPNMELAFYERDTTLEQLILDGVLDAAVSERSFSQDAIVQHLVGKYHLSLIYPISWFSSHEPAPTWADFAQRDMITYEAGQAIRQRSVDFLHEQFGVPPNITVTASGSTSIVRLVEAGLGYAVVPQWMVKHNHPKLSQLVLQEVPPMSIYFAHTALLGSNAFVHQLHQECVQVMSPYLSGMSPNL